MKEFIDYTIFMGMNHKNENIRIACKNFFVRRLNKKIFMSFESVGKCDDVVWGFNRKMQDDYYPFMDNLHTIMDIQRISYNSKDIEKGLNDKVCKKLPTLQKFTLGMVIARKGVLFTFDKRIPSGIKAVKKPEQGKELKFPSNLEKLYQKSLKLKI